MGIPSYLQPSTEWLPSIQLNNIISSRQSPFNSTNHHHSQKNRISYIIIWQYIVNVSLHYVVRYARMNRISSLSASASTVYNSLVFSQKELLNIAEHVRQNSLHIWMITKREFSRFVIYNDTLILSFRAVTLFNISNRERFNIGWSLSRELFIFFVQSLNVFASRQKSPYEYIADTLVRLHVIFREGFITHTTSPASYHFLEPAAFSSFIIEYRRHWTGHFFAISCRRDIALLKQYIRHIHRIYAFQVKFLYFEW